MTERGLWLAEEVTALFDAGLLDVGLQRFEEASVEEREVVLTAPLGWPEPPPRARPRIDLRLRLAMALVVEGRASEATAMLGAMPSPETWLTSNPGRKANLDFQALDLLATRGLEMDAPSPSNEGGEVVWVMARGPAQGFAEAAMEPDDPFDLLLRVINFDSLYRSPPDDPALLALAIDLAEEAGYRALARNLLTTRVRGRLVALGPGPELRLPSEIRDEVANLRVLSDLRRQTFRDRLAAFSGTRGGVEKPWVREGPIDWASVLPSWALPRDERPLEPPEEVSAEIVRQAMLGLDEERPAFSEQELGAGALPQDFLLVTQGENGLHRGAVVLGHALGKRDGVAYWWMDSHDGGLTWSEPVFTGLLIRRPYQLLPDTWLRPQAEGRWRLGAELWNLGPENLWMRTGVGELVLDPDLLRRDRDGDGLTDLVESRLGLDPTHTDSDADGLADAVDPVPQAPFLGAHDPVSRALAAGLEDLLSGARSWRRGTEGRFPVVLGKDLLGSGRLGALDPTEPVIFLESEPHPSKTHWALAFWSPMIIDLFEVDRSGQRAILLTSEGGRSTRNRLELVDGRWTLKLVMLSISCGGSWRGP